MTDRDPDQNETVVSGAIFMALSSFPHILDVSLVEDHWNEIEFGLDFMKSRYRATITIVPEDEDLGEIEPGLYGDGDDAVEVGEVEYTLDDARNRRTS
jgi:hypothetical protein